MSITKIANLKGQIDCPFCFSLLQWDNIEDIKVSNGNQYVVCPECGQTIMLKKGHDYWLTPDSNGQGQGGSSSSQTVVNNDIVVIEYSDNGTEYELLATKEELLSYIEEDKVIIAKHSTVTGNTGSQGKNFNYLILASYYPSVSSNVLVDNFGFGGIGSSLQLIFRAGPDETYPHVSKQGEVTPS